MGGPMGDERTPENEEAVSLGKGKGKARAREPAFEMVVLGSGGGPLETDCSGYLVKPASSSWEDGVLGLEGGSGLGALVNLLEHRDASSLFPDLEFPATHNTAVLRAAYVFSYLTCYLITHAHLDHALSLIMLTGSVPPRPTPTSPSHPPPSSPPATMAPTGRYAIGPSAPRPPVYGRRETLEKLAGAYTGGLWPELASWGNGHGLGQRSAKLETSETPDPLEGDVGGSRKKRRVNGPEMEEVEVVKKEGSGVVLTPLMHSKHHLPLHPTLPISTLAFPVAHGCTSHGLYESSAMFIRHDPLSQSHAEHAEHAEHPNPHDTTASGDETRAATTREFLFFGDVESSWRKPGEEGVHAEIGAKAKVLNRAIWEEAATSWKQGRLSAIFIECSYDSARPAHLMFGHISPPGLYHELQTLASLVADQSAPRTPLSGLRVFVTHIKEALIPHPTGKTAREIIMSELRELEKRGGLGVEFIDVRKGDRIVI